VQIDFERGTVSYSKKMDVRKTPQPKTDDYDGSLQFEKSAATIGEKKKTPEDKTAKRSKEVKCGKLVLSLSTV